MTTTFDTDRRDAAVEQLFQATIGALELLHVYVGDRLGLYAGPREVSDATPEELSVRTGLAERYAREWLEEQAVAGFVDVTADRGDAMTRRYRLPSEVAEVMTDADSLNYLVPLAADWIPALPDIEARLTAGPARVADLGCGSGWSSIAIARAYLAVHVDGIDLDQASVAEARHNAEIAGVADRVVFGYRDAGSPDLAGRYDLVSFFETVHDMADPVASLRAALNLLEPGGAVLVADEKVAESFTAPGDELDGIAKRLETIGRRDHLTVSWQQTPSGNATGANPVRSAGTDRRRRRLMTIGLVGVGVLIVAVHVGLFGSAVAASPWTKWGVNAIVALVLVKVFIVAAHVYLARREARRRKQRATAAKS